MLPRRAQRQQAWQRQSNGSDSPPQLFEKDRRMEVFLQSINPSKPGVGAKSSSSAGALQSPPQSGSLVPRPASTKHCLLFQAKKAFSSPRRHGDQDSKGIRR